MHSFTYTWWKKTVQVAQVAELPTPHNRPDLPPFRLMWCFPGVFLCALWKCQVSLWWSSVRKSWIWHMNNLTINKSQISLHYTSLKPNKDVAHTWLPGWNARVYSLMVLWFSGAKSQDIAEFAQAIGIMSWVASGISPGKKKTVSTPKVVAFFGGNGVLVGFKCRNSRSIWMSDVY